MDPLADGGYPALHEAADAASLRGQKQYLAALKTRLGGLILAAVGGGVLISLGAPEVGGWLALIGFLTALLAEWYTSNQKPDRAWYEGRAAAESVKTLAWRYTVRGDSFDSVSGRGVEVDEGEVAREFISRIRETLHDLNDVDLGEAATSEQITPTMRGIRDSSFLDRKATYREGRIEDQRSWYAEKARHNQRKGHAWGVAVVAAEGLGVLGGVLLIAGIWSIDLLAVFATLAAAATAWGQAKQFKALATAYGITAQELAGVKSELDALQDEAQWARFVGEAEEAISREHTLWRASRGLRLRRRERPN